ncbi:MAG: hypothetical protein V4541_09055 [Bacteroidota bacterium]
MKKNSSYLIISFIAGIFVFLFLIYSLTKQEKNGFVRNINNLETTFINEIDLRSNEFYFHLNSPNLSFKSFKKSNFLLKLDNSLNKISNHIFTTPSKFKFSKTFNNLTSIGSSVFITNSKGMIIKYASDTVAGFYQIPNITFNQGYAISNNSIVVRSTLKNGDIKQRELVKINFTDKATIEKRLLLPKQVDGFFCTDGWLTYDSKLKQLIYTYFYRGEILSLDTNLNVIYSAKTIDTVKQAKLKLLEQNNSLSSGSTIKRTSQTASNNMVNSFSTIGNNNIYILSALKADNDKTDFLKRKQVVDVYDLRKGSYLYSFYLSRYNGYKPRDIKITNNIISVLYDKYLVRYKIR